jgi:5-methylcytosine-specific restriction endonuclease McrA
MMGRPRDHARAIASACNLLDAAACYAGVPLVALMAVLAESGRVNPEAFATGFDKSQRKAIIERSQLHQFVATDYEAISSGLGALQGQGAVKSWKLIESLYPGNLQYLRLVGDYARPNSNAIDDLGSDAPTRTKSEVWSYPRDPKVREAVLMRAKGQCEFCEQLGFLKSDGTRYLESHHVIALADEGEDRTTNVIALCPNDHREAHFGKGRQEMEEKMIFILKGVII